MKKKQIQRLADMLFLLEVSDSKFWFSVEAFGLVSKHALKPLVSIFGVVSKHALKPLVSIFGVVSKHALKPLVSIFLLLFHLTFSPIPFQHPCNCSHAPLVLHCSPSQCVLCVCVCVCEYVCVCVGVCVGVCVVFEVC